MTNEDYLKLHDLLWERIMHLAKQKIDFQEIQESFSKFGEHVAYNTVQLIIKKLSEDESVQIVSMIIKNKFMEIGQLFEDEGLLELVSEINEKNKNEINAVKALINAIKTRKSWEETCFDVENALFPN
jgi:hypothetical protein